MKAQSFKQFVINENSRYFRNGISEFECELEYVSIDETEFPKTDAGLQQHSPEEAEDRAELDKMGLGNTASEIEYSKISSLKLFYDMDGEFGSAGLEGVNVTIKAARISGYYETWDEANQESITHDFEVEFDEATARENITFTVERVMPLEPTYAEIDYNGGLDPKNIKIKVTIGESK